ncbi:uncharacterized protein LOC114362799, partial [Ostrinia furnacalis]|uniref:uncharacterized protein LOC114362799 n=1 Tax=Ostrinia furnacalis TaxID=93504 RepID=UPI00103BBDFC
MPSAASIEISTIFNDVISNNLKYCGVCLRTEEERRLVNPEHFLKCIGIMSLAAPLIKTICYVCEAEATRAFALFQAINFAEIINQWFKDMSGKLKYRDEMPDFLDRYINRRARLRGSAPLAEWWRRVRARSDLVQTEVLVVSDAAP